MYCPSARRWRDESSPPPDLDNPSSPLQPTRASPNAGGSDGPQQVRRQGTARHLQRSRFGNRPLAAADCRRPWSWTPDPDATAAANVAMVVRNSQLGQRVQRQAQHCNQVSDTASFQRRSLPSRGQVNSVLQLRAKRGSIHRHGMKETRHVGAPGAPVPICCPAILPVLTSCGAGHIPTRRRPGQAAPTMLAPEPEQ